MSRTDILHVLQEDGKEGQRPEHGEAHDETDGAGGVEHPLSEELEGDHRLLGPVLHEKEEKSGHHARYDQGDTLAGSPTPRDATQTGEEDEQRGGSGERERSEVVDGVMDTPQGAGKNRPGDEQSQDAERQVDVEDPPPREVGHAEATDERPDDRGHTEHGPEETRVATALAR
jgi:hypothetical protein